MGVNVTKWMSVSGISLGLLLMLTQFQNCAPAGLDAQATASNQPIDSEVRVIDDWNQTRVSITNKVVQTNSDDGGVSVQGLCDRKMLAGEPMSWRVHQPQDDEAVLAGAVSCQRGGFDLQITQLKQLRCGMAYSLEVRTLDGDVDHAVLIRNCSL